MDAPSFDRVVAFASKIAAETEFIAALVGSIVGGLIAFGVQMISLRDARRVRTQEALRADQARAHAILFKLIKVHSNVKGVRDHLDEHFVNAKKSGLGGEPWQFVRQIANPPPDLFFTSDEMGMLLSLKDDSLFNKVASLDARHNAVMEGVRVFNSERSELQRMIRPSSFEGAIGTGVFGEQDLMRLRPSMINVNQLVEGTLQISNECVVDSRKSLTELQELFNRKLGMKYKLEFI